VPHSPNPAFGDEMLYHFLWIAGGDQIDQVFLRAGRSVFDFYKSASGKFGIFEQIATKRVVLLLNNLKCYDNFATRPPPTFAALR